jgi:hypothetical protein
MTPSVNNLPLPVMRWLEVSGAAGRPLPAAVHLTQRGELRLAPDKPWMPYAATQRFTTDAPGFDWRARVRMLGLPLMSVHDSLSGGTARMQARFLGIPVVNGHGPELQQGALLRYLGEISWFPMAARCPWITWADAGELAAHSILAVGGQHVEARWEFRPDGQPRRFSARRYAAIGKEYRLLDWWVDYTAFRSFDQVTVGSECSVYWGYPGGEFCWLRLALSELTFN